MIKKILLTATLIVFIFSCSSQENSVWQKASKFVRYHSSDNYINHVDPVFKMMQGTHKVSDWLQYFFSPLSTRNWVSEGEELAEYSREPVIPRGIVFRNSVRDTSVAGNQLVVSVDDASEMILVKGYEKDDEDPVFEDNWKFPKITQRTK